MVQILEASDALSTADRGGVAAMGNFDGVHLGHAEVVRQAGALAKSLNTDLVAVVFKPHPRRYFRPDTPPFRLMSDHQRAEALGELGVQRVHHLAFGPGLAAMSPEEFARDILKERLGLEGVVTGADFHFGKDRAGDPETLRHFGQTLGFETAIAAEQSDHGAKISSTMIRKALEEGDPEKARALLSRPYTIEGVVFRGDQRGRQLGFPTANILLNDYLRPKFGVYAVTVTLQGRNQHLTGVANVGRRPTVEGTREQLEVYIFDFDEDIYGQNIEVGLEAFIRSEKKFEGLDELKAQIDIDCEAAKTWFQSSL